MRLLVVEDEPVLADSIADGLRRHTYAVDVAYDGNTALTRLGVNAYDVVVLDRDLPDVSGDQVCRTLVDQATDTRVLMLTAAAAVGDRIAGLDLGADDYLVKPFDFAELVARVRALGRRTRPVTSPVLQRESIALDPVRHEASRAGRALSLTRKEFGVLEELLRGDGAVVSSEQLLEKVWDENIDPFTNVVRVTMLSLRRKLGDPPVIATVTGVGYQIR
ncbi:MAG: response regulator transcription factor [Dactylosporangium sp.]|nr:response regulator transcription factor [Dactylosporangium sp.]NNJ60829.1 response regulator transcription factor [Dactylosporangium sp.]